MTTLATPGGRIRDARGPARPDARIVLPVLSVRQPHADAFFADEDPKFCENRSWETKHRGELWIHASRWEAGERISAGEGVVGAIIGRVSVFECLTVDDLDCLSLIPQRYTKRDLAAASRNAKCDAAALIERYRDVHTLLGFCTQAQYEAHVCGNWCWIITDCELLREPIPCTGKLNIWRFEAQADRLVMR